MFRKIRSKIASRRERKSAALTGSSMKSWYMRRRTIALTSLILSAAVVFVVAVWSISVSQLNLGFERTWNIVINALSGATYDKKTQYLDWYYSKYVIRDLAPRVVMAVGVGGILAVCGAMMQSVTRNPLTDPYTIGISSAALLGVTISIAYGICIIPFIDGDYGEIANAFVFSLIPAFVILAVSSFKKLSPTMMVLIGIGMMYVFTAFSTLIKFNATEESLKQIYEWGLGTLVKANWDNTQLVLIVLVFLTVCTLFISKKMNILSAGDKISQSLGVNASRLRIICFTLVSFAVAVVVCFTGTIGFVGLVAPHIARLLVGNDNARLIPASVVTGALMMILSDVVVRVIPGGLPVGVMTAILGSPLFLIILVKMRRQSNF